MYPFGSKIRTSLSTKCAAGGNQCANENSRQWPKLHFISKVSRETIIYAEYMQPASITILWTDNGIKWSHHYDSFADQAFVTLTKLARPPWVTTVTVRAYGPGEAPGLGAETWPVGPAGAAGFGTWACCSAAKAVLGLAAAGLGTLV